MYDVCILSAHCIADAIDALLFTQNRQNNLYTNILFSYYYNDSTQQQYEYVW